RLSGPGYTGQVAPNSVSFTGGGTSVVATYLFTPPGGSWDFFDGGVYTLTMAANQIFDTDGPSAVLPGSIGSFLATIPGTVTVDTAADVDNGVYTSGDLSLREAIRLANTLSPGATDTI